MNRRLDVTSEIPNERIVIGVGADPEPDHLVPGPHANRSPAQSDSNGVDRLSRVNGFEAETWVIGILSPKPVSGSGVLLDFTRKVTIGLPKSISGP
jgi:hypothetical protein